MIRTDREPRYWRSLEAFEGSQELPEELQDELPEALQEALIQEFPERADELLDPVSRRRFMQVMGASMALAGVTTTGCRRWEKEEIVPLSERPDGYIPGNAMHYATTIELGGFAQGVVATAFDGRPVKIEGNEQDPLGLGRTTAFTQASILHLYDPDRSLTVRKAGAKMTWKDVRTELGGAQLGDGAGLHILSEASDSPTLVTLRQQLAQKYPRARWHEYEPLSTDNERIGLQQLYGRPLRALANINRAQRVISIDADLLVDHPAALKYAREYAVRRHPEQNNHPDTMMRLYAIESGLSHTGAMADHRLPLPSSEIPAFLADLDKALDGSVPGTDDARARFIAMMADDLGQRLHRGRVVFVAGHRQPPAVHAMVANLNAKVGGLISNAVEYLPLPQESVQSSHFDAIKTLAAAMNNNQVQTLLMLGGNPVYDAPADLNFGAALAKVKLSVHLSAYYDETSSACTWHLPRTHFLEAWGDARSYDGTVFLAQPLIEPMKIPGDRKSGAKSAIEVLSLFVTGKLVPGQELVRQTFDTQFARGADQERVWRKALHDGHVAATAYRPVRPGSPRPLPPMAPNAPLGKDNIEVVFTSSSHTYDGRFANNAWLQETPDFMTKLTWDNAALINPNTADELGVSNGEMIEVTLDGRTVRIAAYTMPGQARYSIALALGHGRNRAGRVAGSVDDGVSAKGFDVYPLRGSDAPFIATGAKVDGLGKSYTLASTQDHWNMDDIGRKGVEQRLGTLVREGTFVDFIAFQREKSQKAMAPGRAKQAGASNFGDAQGVKAGLHEVHLDYYKNAPGINDSLWTEHDYDRPRHGSRSPRYKWGMSIDLDKCTGCNACMLACQAENNVPVVGKKQVLNSREMHWIRIDRYFTGEDIRDNPRVAHQPVACQQCEMAPCEQVCPVGATIHSSEGLNDMVYNRCVGTRYCLNNCPYKVRRFNFTDYHHRDELPGGSLDDARNKVRKLLFNPEVTVRSRGVMEKCTFCIQRIQAGKITAKNEGRLVRDGEVMTACQQACPSNAIEFGNLNDRNSRVASNHRSERSYELLSELNLNNRNLFLTRIRNPYQSKAESEQTKPEQG